MEIKGRIIKIMDIRTGVSKSSGAPWMSQTYIIETQENHPRTVAFEVFGEDRIKQMNIQVGEDLIVTFELDAREYQGRWYNQVRAYRVERAQQIVTPAIEPFVTGVQEPLANPVANVDPLPFDNPNDDLEDLPF